jgi:hypothetical protein
MKATKNITVILELTAEETKYLHGITQNHMYGDPDGEPQEERVIRIALFNATNLSEVPYDR